MPVEEYTVQGDVIAEDADGVKLRFFEGDVIAMSTAYRFGLPDSTSSTESMAQATTDGSGAGQIGSGSPLVTVESDDANKIITLPDPVPGTVISLRNGATGYELRTNDPSTVAINGGTGANAESAILSNILTICLCDTETTWICSDTTTAGVVSATEVASA